MGTLGVVGAVAIAVAVVTLFVLLDVLANRWARLLPQGIRRRGLLGVLFERLRARGTRRP